MADSKISNLNELTVAPDAGDLFVIVDVSDTTMSASGTTKKIQSSNVTISDASTTVKGKVELATDAEAATSTDTVRALTPSNGKSIVSGATVVATSKTTPIDADSIPLVDSAASNVLKQLNWANIKATLKTYFDTLYTKATYTELNTGTDDAKFATALAIANSTLMKFSYTRFKVGKFTRDLSAASGSVATTGVGFQPKVVVFIYNVPNTAVQGYGYYDGTTQGGVFYNGVAGQMISDDFAVVLRTANTPADNYGSGITLDSDGFTITWTKRSTPTGTANIFYLALR